MHYEKYKKTFYMKRLIYFACFFLISITTSFLQAQTYDIWDGSINTDWYTNNTGLANFTISSGKELAGLAQLVNSGTSFLGKAIILDADIDLNNRDWEPIGNNLNHFKGSFDGNNHIIKNLSVGQNNDTYGFSGLFGRIDADNANIIICNLILDSGAVTGSSTDVVYTGALAGYTGAASRKVTIENCHTIGIIVKGREGSGTSFSVTGGLIGAAVSSGSGIISISRCHTTGNVTGGIAQSSLSYTGGIAGQFYISGGNINISHTYVAGTITGATANSSCTSGIVGRIENNVNNASISYSYVAGAIIGVNGTNNYTGGIVGNGANVSIRYCLVVSPSISNGENIHRIIGNSNASNLTGNYAYPGITGTTWGNAGKEATKVEGADWDGLMASAPISLNSSSDKWDPTVWDIDPTDKRMPKLKGVNKQTDIPNPMQAYLIGGDSEGNPHLIKTVNDLIRVCNNVNAGLTNWQTAWYKIDDNTSILDLAGLDWEPIGNNTNSFKGNFDGNNCIIRNLSVGQGSNTYIYSGFFGYVNTNGGNNSIKNLAFSGGAVTGDGNHTGTLAGYIKGESNAILTIENCHAKDISVNISDGIMKSYSYTGGLIGWAVSKGNSHIMIKKCYFTGSIIGGKASTDSYTGGIVGQAHGDGGNVSIKDTYFAGNITGGEADGVSSTGGIAGWAFGYTGNSSAEISYSYAAGIITGGTGGSVVTGGIVGEAWSKSGCTVEVRNCVVVSSSINTGNSVHRIVGLKKEEGVIIFNENYASANIAGGTWDDKGIGKLDGADWDGLMTSAPILFNNSISYRWDDINTWDIDSSNKRMPLFKNVSGQADIFNPVCYYMAFNAQGGTPVDTMHYIYKDSIIPSAPVSTRNRLTFEGWYNGTPSEPFQSVWTFRTDAVTQDTTLYARWKASVIFEANGGISIPPNQVIDVDSLITEPIRPVKTNALFAGWYSDISFQVLWNFQTDPVTQDMTLYLKWLDGELGISPIPTPVYGMNYSHQLTPTNGTAPYTFGILGNLPDGLSFDAATGEISGIPTTIDTYNITIQVADAFGNSANIVSILTIEKAQLSLVLQDGTATYTGGNLYTTPAVLTGIIGNENFTIDYSYYHTTNQAIANHALNAGTYTVTASVAGDANHTGTSATATLTVGKATPVIGLTSVSTIYTGNPVPVNAPVITGSATAAGLPFDIEYTGIGGTVYPPTAIVPSEVGQYRVTVSTVGDSNHNNTSASTTISIGKAIPQMSLGDASKIYDGRPFIVTASVTPNTLAVEYSYSGTLYDGTSYGPDSPDAPFDAGFYTVITSTPGDHNYNPAQVTANLDISQKQPSITISNKSTPYTGSPVAIDASVGEPAGAPLVITYKGIGSTVYTESATAPTDGGTYGVKASYAGSNNYEAKEVTAYLTITDAGAPVLTLNNRTVTYNSHPQLIGNAVIETPGAEHLAVTYIYTGILANGSSYGPYSPSSLSDPLAPTGAGVYTITATTPANNNFAAGSVTATLTIEKTPQIISFNLPSNKILGSPAFPAGASVNTGFPLTYKSGNPAIATISDAGLITLLGLGTATFTVSQEGNENYLPAGETRTLFVEDPNSVVEYIDVFVNLELPNPALRNCIGLNPVEGSIRAVKNKVYEQRIWLDNTTSLSQVTVELDGQKISPARTELFPAVTDTTQKVWEWLYIYRMVLTNDAQIHISGFSWNDGKNPVGIIHPSGGSASVYTLPGYIVLEQGCNETTKQGPVSVYMMTGQLVYANTSLTGNWGTLSIPVDKGIYIVVIDGHSWKVFVK